jgi:hypothetical protein
MVVPAFGDLFFFADMCHKVRCFQAPGNGVQFGFCQCACCVCVDPISLSHKETSVKQRSLQSLRVPHTHVGCLLFVPPQLQLGVGPAPIPLPDLTAERLTTALHQLVRQQEQYSAAAAKVAGELLNEDGLAAAVASVARTLSSAAQKPVVNN